MGPIGRLALIMIVAAQGAVAQAERPPAGYTGREWVDSNGCIYVRAEIDGAIAWAARVDRNRNPVCNATSAPAQTEATAAAASTGLAPSVRVRTRRSVDIRARPGMPRKFPVPPGYKLVWQDDRLNPDRGPRSDTGEASTDAVWTRTTPRRLIAE